MQKLFLIETVVVVLDLSVLINYDTIRHKTQHIATRWPNTRNMLRPKLLRYVALACCDRLAGALRFDLKVKINYGISRYTGFRE